MKNLSQLDDLNGDQQEQFEFRVRHEDGNLQGIAIPLGHTFSLILEELARQGKPLASDQQGYSKVAQEFVAFIDSRQSWYNTGTTLRTPHVPFRNS